MSNQYRANDHLFNKLFIAYAEIDKNNKLKHSINLREIVEDNRCELDSMVLEYCSSLCGKSEDDSKSESIFNVPSGISIRNYSDALYDYEKLPHLADEKCRFLLRAIYRSIYVEAEKNMRLSLVKDTIANIIHESRELRNIEYLYLRKWIDDLDNIYFLVDLSLLSSESEIEKARNELINRILPTDDNSKRFNLSSLLSVLLKLVLLLTFKMKLLLFAITLNLYIQMRCLFAELQKHQRFYLIIRIIVLMYQMMKSIYSYWTITFQTKMN